MSILQYLNELSTVVKVCATLSIFIVILIMHFIRTNNQDSEKNNNDSELYHDPEFVKKIRDSKRIEYDDDDED